MRKLSNIFLILAIICVTDTMATKNETSNIAYLTVSSHVHKPYWTSFHMSSFNPFKGMMHWKMPKMADISTKPWFFPGYQAWSKQHQKLKEARTRPNRIAS